MDSGSFYCVPSSGEDINWNSGGDGSNALVLPGRKKVKGKVCGKSGIKETQKMSKSKMRKLKQLQEEKEKKLLLYKSIRTLENNKIWDGAYSLMQSSGTIGQAETKREKRRRAVHLSKVGIEVLEDVPSPKKCCNQNYGLQEATFHNDSDEEHLNDVRIDDKFPLLRCNNAVLCKNSHLLSDLSTNESFKSLESGSCEALPTSKVSYEVKSKNNYSCVPDDQLVPSTMLARLETKLENNSLSMEVGRSDLGFQGRNAEELVVQKPVTGVIVVHVKRPDEIEEKRRDLPVVMMEQEIMEAINEHPIVIICGETGCGKTTQVPQFLYEAGFGSKANSNRMGTIAVTQPRRVAVLSTAKRVAYELGLRLGVEVGFQMRHDKKLGDNCSIKFMTDGILLREIQGDFLLKRYSVIILDEAHERSLNTDILIGLLSGIIRLRQQLYTEQQQLILSGVHISPENMVSPLKLVLMSATLRVEDFNGKLFHETPCLVKIATRQFRVSIHFSKTTKEDYLGQAYKKVISIHKRLPPGGILVFVTGQREVELLCTKLRKSSKKLVQNKSNSCCTVRVDIDNNVSEAFQTGGNSHDQLTGGFDSYDEDPDDPELDSFSSDSLSDTDSELEFEDEASEMPDGFGKNADSLASLKAAFDAISQKKIPCSSDMDQVPSHSVVAVNGCSEKIAASVGPLIVLPLYAMLPASEQLRVFEEVPEGERLVVVATNVAETSLTIPGIKYVIDTGKEKVKTYKYGSGMATFEVKWISKASASQRSGRAGRTGPGHCYRLYSAAAFGRDDVFPKFASPEIANIPVDGVALVMKSMGIDKIADFPFPTPPKIEALEEAEQCLKALEALDTRGQLTAVGKAMAQYPMSPRHSRMLLTVLQIMRNQEGCARANIILGYAVAVAAALSFPNPFLKLQFENEDNNVDEELQRRSKKAAKAKAKEVRSRFRNASSDAFTVAYALQLFELAEDAVSFSNENSLHFKTMDEMSKLRKQLLQLIFRQSKSCQDFSWNHGSAEEVELSWRKCSDQYPLVLNEEEILGKAICAGWADRVARRNRAVSQATAENARVHAMRYQSCAMDGDVFLHRSSSVSRSAPEFLVYTELLCAKRPYMHGATAVRPDWLVHYGRPICTFSAPLVDPKPYYDPLGDQVLCWVNPFFGRHNWQLPLHGIPIQNNKLRISVFAAALLEGHVLPCMRSARNFLAAQPSIMISKPESRGQIRVGELLHCLDIGSGAIDSRSKLREAWSHDARASRALYVAMRCWFQEKFCDQFDEFWDRMQQEVLMEGHQLFPKMAKKK